VNDPTVPPESFDEDAYLAANPDVAAIDRCRDHLSDIAQFTLNRARPPLPIDRSVDLVYAISVYTH
jgi:hypothetical protein